MMILRRRGWMVLGALAAAVPLHAQEGPQPSQQHKLLEKEVGEWVGASTMWPAPGVDPMKSSGEESNKMLGGFWLQSEFKGEFAGMPFAGRGQLGFDPDSGQYVMTWVDSVSPSLFIARGGYDEQSRTLTLIGECTDVMTGEKKRYKAVSQYQDTDHKNFTMHEADLGSDDWRKSMEIRYTRKKK